MQDYSQWMQETGQASMASSMHSTEPPSGLTTSDFSLSLSSLNTSGQTSSQLPQPMHSSSSMTTFLAMEDSVHMGGAMVTRARNSLFALSPWGSAISQISTSPVRAGRVAPSFPRNSHDIEGQVSIVIIEGVGEFLARPEIEI